MALIVSLVTSAMASAQSEAADELSEPPAEESTSPIRVEALAGTTAPVDLSVGARAIVFDRLIVSGSLGVGIYGGLAGAIARPFGGDDVANVAETLTNGVVVFRAGAGVRPFGANGPELVASYALLHRSTTLDLATLAAIYDLGAREGDVDVTLTLHAVHFEFGWTIAIADSFILRPAFGWLHPLEGEAELRVMRTQTAREQAVVSEVEAELTDALTSYVMTPTLSLTAGWRF